MFILLKMMNLLGHSMIYIDDGEIMKKIISWSIILIGAYICLLNCINIFGNMIDYLIVFIFTIWIVSLIWFVYYFIKFSVSYSRCYNERKH